jgi:hypothetical protein
LYSFILFRLGYGRIFTYKGKAKIMSYCKGVNITAIGTDERNKINWTGRN